MASLSWRSAVLEAAAETSDDMGAHVVVGVKGEGTVQYQGGDDDGVFVVLPRAAPATVRLGDKLDLLHAACEEAGELPYTNGNKSERRIRSPVGLDAAGWHVRVHSSIKMCEEADDPETEVQVDGEVMSYDEDDNTYAVSVGGSTEETLTVKREDLIFVAPPTADSDRDKEEAMMETLEEVEKRLGNGTIKSACFKVLKAAAPAGLSLSDIVFTTQKQGLKDWSAVKQPTNTVNAILSVDPAFMRTAPGRFALKGVEGTVNVGQTIMRHFPEDNEWLEATVADYDELSRQHRLVYRLNTSQETFEWLQLGALGPDLLRFPGNKKVSVADSFVCDGCAKSFDTINGLRMHTARWCPQAAALAAGNGSVKKDKDSADQGNGYTTTKSDRQKRYRDNNSGATFDDQDSPDEEPPEGSFQCEQCMRLFDSVGGLRMHTSRWCPLRPAALNPEPKPYVEEIPKDPEEMYECPYCSKRFNAAGGLRMHASRWCAFRPGGTHSADG